MLIESLRDIGYDLESALADIIDNSITAAARTVHIFTAAEDGKFRVGILDDGHGMTEAQLLQAMHIGSRSPLDERSPFDLGRFGLGLKTASFSQCRRLTVVTRRSGATSAAVWDLDYVAEVDDWMLELPDAVESLPWVAKLGLEGTLVIWEKLDRLAGAPGGRIEGNHQHVTERLDNAREHLELVFHRFLAGQKATRKITILFNKRELVPFDPFNSNHPATQWGQIERIQAGGEIVKVQACTLPHFSKVTSADWTKYGGRAGYLKSQGFYLYRAHRLIVRGTWFGLARQTALTQLSRVRIDIPTGLDAQWKIDVKKAHAQPPYEVRARLRNLIDTLGAPSKRVFTGKSPALATEGDLPMWSRVQGRNSITYRINEAHPSVQSFAANLPPDLVPVFERVLDLVGSTLPLDALLIDLNGKPEQVMQAKTSDESLALALTDTINRLRSRNVPTADIITLLGVIDPFKSCWERTEQLLAEMQSGITQ